MGIKNTLMCQFKKPAILIEGLQRRQGNLYCAIPKFPVELMQPNTVRIIGGQWRGRKLHFPAVAGLRPTPDRVRETVFNWLMPVIRDARCLDLFAGSGALGIEALSRGAAHVTFVDQNPTVVSYLKEQIAMLDAINKAEVYCSEAIGWSTTSRFNIIFIDPPFNQNLIEPCCRQLIKSNLLAPEAYIYIEAEATLKRLPIPTDWELLKTKVAGQVGYHLFFRRPG
jgi:16S rRNA (guanine966-N2)-methyltransferase